MSESTCRFGFKSGDSIIDEITAIKFGQLLPWPSGSVGALSQCAKVAGSVVSEAHTGISQWMHR